MKPTLSPPMFAQRPAGMLAALMLLHCVVATQCKADGPTAKDILRTWRARQANVETVDCRVQALSRYAAGSQVVFGEEQRRPIGPRSSKREARLQISGASKWRVHHTGPQFHRRFGQMLDFDLTRMCDGNQYCVLERPYPKIPDWTPKPRLYSQARLFHQESSWHDLLLTPLLLHYRPFNTVLCPFWDRPYEVAANRQRINGAECILLRPAKDAAFSVRTHQYWVRADRDHEIARIERLINDAVEWQFDITYKEEAGQRVPNAYVIRRFRANQMTEFLKVSVTDLSVNQPVDDSVFVFDGDPTIPLSR